MHYPIEQDPRYGATTDEQAEQERQRDYRDAWRVEDFEAAKAQAVAPVADMGAETEPPGGWPF